MFKHLKHVVASTGNFDIFGTFNTFFQCYLSSITVFPAESGQSICI